MDSIKKLIDKKTLHKKEYDSRVNERRMQTTEEKVETSNALDANIRPIYDEEPMAEGDCFLEMVPDEECVVLEMSLVRMNAALKVDEDVFIVRKVIETINIELKHKVAKLLKENETLKKHYKDLYDSIKVTRTKTIELTTSLIAKNDEFKAQLQEKGFAIAALKNEPRFASQVDVNSDLSKPVTTYYFPKGKESVCAKPHHMIAPGSSRYSSNDMVHNHYLEEAKKSTQERGKNSRPSVMPSAKSQRTDNYNKPKPRINNQNSRNWHASKTSCISTKIVPIAEHSRNSRNFSDSKHFVCSTCQKCVFNANHDTCVTKFLNEVNSRAKVPSYKTTKRYKPIKQISIAKKPERQIATGHRFSIKKTSSMLEKTIIPRSCLRWKQTGRIFKTVGLKWVSTRKIFTSSTTNVDSEPINGSNEDITNQYECEHTLDVSASTLNLSAMLRVILFSIHSDEWKSFQSQHQTTLRGISIGTSFHLSHLFYVDDAVFLGQWSNSNIGVIVKVLECFYRASGLRINMNKSKLMGISIAYDIVDQAANNIGCTTLKAPFSYLGSKVGDLISRTCTWNDILNNLANRLSKWKMKTLSIGGRLTLLKSLLGSMHIYHMSLFKVPIKVLQKMEYIRCHFFNGVDQNGKKPIWVKWNKVLASKEKGGLGIHDEDGKLNKNASHNHSSIWLDIIREMMHLKNNGMDMCGFIHKKMGNGFDTSFWQDVWRGEDDFKSAYPRVFALETRKCITVAEKLSKQSLGYSFRCNP
ncbi:hypothetical protein Tco_0798306 [Tanacetum coccineum]